MFSPKDMADQLTTNKVSISKLAKLTGQDRALVSSWANGRRTPTVDSLVRVADALGCSLDDLVLRGEAREKALQEAATAAAQE